MIKHLFIKDYILIDQIQLDFESGFSAFTGETGAGKSILIDAIGLLSADRASSSMVKKGKEAAFIEGIFDLSNNTKACEILELEGFDTTNYIVISREIKADGKSVAKINYRIVTLALLKMCLENELDIHSQHDNQYLLNKNYHIQLLDRYMNIPSKLNDLAECYQKYATVKRELERAKEEEYNVSDLDYFQYQIEEINNANLKIGEDDELEQQEQNVTSVAKNIEKYTNILTIFDDSIQNNLFECKRILESVDKNESTELLLDKVTSSYYDLVDAFDSFKDFYSSYELNEVDLDSIQSRLYDIQKLKHKYGTTIEAILTVKENLENKVNIINNRQDVLSEMENNVQQAFEKFEKLAQEISNLRKKAAKELDILIMKNLNDLMLPHAKFITRIEPSTPNKNGIDCVEFMISMNPGEDCKSLVKVASGGELSRLMLGLKTIFTSLQGIQTIIFDEIDSGVSGPVATSIGKKMQELAKTVQVFSVTHLAPVASCAKYQYHVQKSQSSNSTDTMIIQLSDEERIKQLAMILAGSVTETSLATARELFVTNHG